MKDRGMHLSSTQPPMETIAIAERLLSEYFGARIRLGEGIEPGGGSNRSKVYRLTVLEGLSDAPEHVIVKQANSTDKGPYKPESHPVPAWRFFTEWAVLQFLSQISAGVPCGPRFYGGDRASGLIVM